MRSTIAMTEHGDSVRTILFFDRGHSLGYEGERLVPGNGLKALLTADLNPHQWSGQAIGVGIGADTPGTSRAQSALAVQIIFVTNDLPGNPVFVVYPSGAFPETYIANRGGCQGLIR
jgi:hypothetical protein